jgi:uncharacterized protein (UPF0128 family)
VAYDEQLARARTLLTGERQVAKKAMFGRWMFMAAGTSRAASVGDE